MSLLFRIAFALEVLALVAGVLTPNPPTWLLMALLCACAAGVLLALAGIALDH